IFKRILLMYGLILFRCSLKVTTNYRIILTLFVILFAACKTTDKLLTYDVPGGEEFSSPDYIVTIEQNGKIYPSFVHYSHALDEYSRYHTWDKKLFQRNITPVEKRTTLSHSSAIFSFSGKITVRVTVTPEAKHINLPLTSAKVLPSSYNIP